MQCIVDNLTESEEKRLQLILQIQKLYQDSIPISEIVRITGKDPNTVRKYILGDPSNLCRSNRHGKLEGYQDYIIKCIQEGMNQSEIAKSLAALGYQGSSTNARTYVCNLAKRHHLKLRRYQYTAPRSDEKNIKKPDADYITRKGIFNYIWMGGELSRAHHEYLWNSYPVLQELESCTRQFREFFEKKTCLFFIFS